ncbi:hypothetical protein CLAFUR4_02803 [Fulvia fulva]|nr:hypothetical protein CLAFUR4_02803 [Fulvia fulva]WPV25796.1 hypothetical protein CLAFUW7_02807 [Fulvia fulva]
MDDPPQPDPPQPVDEFGLPPPTEREPTADDPEPEPEPEAAPPPEPPADDPAPEPEVPEPEPAPPADDPAPESEAVPPPAPPSVDPEHVDATPAVVIKEDDTLKIVPIIEPSPSPSVEPPPVEPPPVEPPPVEPPPVEPPAVEPPAVEPPVAKEPEAPIAPVPVPDDHGVAATTIETTSVEPAALVVPPEAPVAIEQVASHEAIAPEPVPVAVIVPATTRETPLVTSDITPAPAVEQDVVHHDTAAIATSGTDTPAPSTRTNITRITAASLADLPTPTEVFAGHAAEHATTLTMKDGVIFHESGEALYRINDRTFTDKQNAPVFDLRRGHFRRSTWKVKPKVTKSDKKSDTKSDTKSVTTSKIRIRARQHYGVFKVPMPPMSTGGHKNREAVLHANQLRLGATKSAFENKAIVGMVDNDKMHVAKGFDLALAGAIWKAQTDTSQKHARRQSAFAKLKTKKLTKKPKVKSTKSSKSNKSSSHSAATV